MKYDTPKMLWSARHWIEVMEDADRLQIQTNQVLIGMAGISRRDDGTIPEWDPECALNLRFASKADRDRAFAVLSEYVGARL